MPKPTAPGATATPPMQTVGDALARARGSLLQFAKSAVAQDDPEPVQATETPTVTPGLVADAQQPADTDADLSQNAEPPATEPEAPEEAPPEPPEAPDIDPIPEAVQESINKRIGKEVAKTKAALEARESAEVRAAELEAELETLRREPSPSASASVPEAPLDHIHDARQLEREREKAEQAREQAEQLMDTLELNPDDAERALRAAGIPLRDASGDEDYSPARMKQFLRTVTRNAEKSLSRHIPARAQFLDQSGKYTAQAQEWMPEIKDKSSPRYQKFHQVLKSHPELRRHPYWASAAVVQVLGLEALEALQKKPAATVPAAPRPAPKLPAAPRSAVTPAARRGADMDTLRAQAFSGDRNARVAYLENVIGDE